MWPGGWGYIHRHTHNSLIFPPNPCPAPAPGGRTLGKALPKTFLEVADPPPLRVQSRTRARNQQPASGLPRSGSAQRSPKLAGDSSIPQGWLGPWCSERSAKRRTGFNLPLRAVLGLPGLQEPDARQPVRPGKGRGPSAAGSQQITLLGMELWPAVLASLARALQRGHGLRQGESPTRAPMQPPPQQRC